MRHIFGDSALPSLGVVTAGGTKFAYPGEVLDLMGLNHRTMGHSDVERRGFRGHVAFDPELFFELRPEILVPQVMRDPGLLRPYQRDSWENRVLKDLFFDPRFGAQYALARVRRRATSDAALAAYYRRDYLQAILSQDRFTVELPAEAPGGS